MSLQKPIPLRQRLVVPRDLAKEYPIDLVTYLTDQLVPPPEVFLAKKNTEDAGFYVMPITGDKFNIKGRPPTAFESPEQVRKQEKPIKANQAPFRHIKDITMPKMEKYFMKYPAAKGFFLAEGDLCLKKGYTFDDWYREYGEVKEITWFGYKKILKQKGKLHYIVGNFMIYIPREKMGFLMERFSKQKADIFSDRFFTNLVIEGEVTLNPTSIAGEIEHVSAVAGGKVRKAKDCHLNTQLPLYETLKQGIRKVEIATIGGAGTHSEEAQKLIEKRRAEAAGKMSFLPANFRRSALGKPK